MRDRVALALFAVIILLTPSFACAADLVQPWAKGLSNLELYLSAEQGQRREVSLLLGGGLTPALSLGVFAVAGEAQRTVGALALYSFSLRPGIEMDVWLEVGGAFLPREAEQREACLTGGVEASWSQPWGIPYARLTASREGREQTVHPLLGVQVPAGDRWRLHWELSSEKVSGQPWPLHLAFGPNLVLGESAMLLTEVAYVRPGGGGAGVWSALVGVIVDPRLLSASPKARH